MDLPSRIPRARVLRDSAEISIPRASEESIQHATRLPGPGAPKEAFDQRAARIEIQKTRKSGVSPRVGTHFSGISCGTMEIKEPRFREPARDLESMIQETCFPAIR